MKRQHPRHGGWTADLAVSPEELLLVIQKRNQWLAPLGVGSAGEPAVDIRDALPGVSEHLYVKDPHRQEIAGVVRVSFPSDALARAEGTRTGLNLARKYDDTELAGASVAQIEFVVVDPRHRGTLAAPTLIDAAFGYLRKRGIELAVGTASLGTTCERDSFIAMHALAARDLVHPDLWLPALSLDPGRPSSQPQALYSPDERRRALRGDFRKLRIPSTLKLYGRFGARAAGEPQPFGVHGIYVVPVLARVPEVSLLASTTLIDEETYPSAA